MFDWEGNLLDHASLQRLIKSTEETYAAVKGYFIHRDILESYVNGIDNWLTQSFIQDITNLIKYGCTKIVLLVDTYEMMTGCDDWMCGTFVKELPNDVKLFIFCRDRLNRVNPDWSQHETNVYYHELRELSIQEAKEYLRHHGLKSKASLDRVYEFTGGYPLCLTLAAELARELGWEGVGNFEGLANRDRVASQLLERILKQEKVKEVQEFLEKGVVARWFDPGAVSYMLQVSPERGKEIYDKIGKFSFVQPHPNGLKFHDRVRELLVERLKFMDDNKTYRSLARMWSEYLKIKAGIIDAQMTNAIKEEDSKIQVSRTKLHQILVEYFDEGELHNLCYFDLGVNYHALPGYGTDAKARELIAYCERQGQFFNLARTIYEQRPHAFR